MEHTVLEEIVETDPATPPATSARTPTVSFVIACAGDVADCLAMVGERVAAGQPEAEVLFLVRGPETAKRVALVLPSWIRVVAGTEDADLTALRRQGVLLASGDVIRLLDAPALTSEGIRTGWPARPDWARLLGRGDTKPPGTPSSS